MVGKFWTSKKDTAIVDSEEKHVSNSDVEAHSEEGEVLQVSGDYKSPWRYNSPLIQVFVTSLAAFGCPGMFNALTGLGSSGIDTQTSDKGQIALQSVFAGGSLFIAPIVYHYVGPGYSMFAGGLFYPLYSGSLLCYQIYYQGGRDPNKAFVVGASAALGLGASLFWIGQGAVVTSVPLENEKGRLFGLFWFVFNMGGVIGSFISMGINWDNNSTYIKYSLYAVFMALMGAGWFSTLLVRQPSFVIRQDGSRIRENRKRPDVIRDFIEICKLVLRKESLCMIPYFFMSNYFYSYQQNTVNGDLFSVRTRSFNSAMYWLAQMIASPLLGAFLDLKRIRHKRRGFYAFLFLCVYSLILWGGGLALNLRAYTSGGSYYGAGILDMITSGTKYAGPFVEYFGYGMFDAFWQTLAYWIMASMTANNAADQDKTEAAYVGLYKGVQAAGAAVAWKVNAVTTADLPDSDVEFGINWGLISLSLAVLTPVFWWMKDPPEETDREEHIASSVEEFN